MELRLERIARKEGYTIGRLMMDGKHFCDTLEPAVAARAHAAIPEGTYAVTLGIRSAKYSNFTRYPWAERYNAMLPRLVAVPGREGILIHVGNTAAHTQGCILVGRNRVRGMVTDSVATFTALMERLRKAKDIKITIV